MSNETTPRSKTAEKTNEKPVLSINAKRFMTIGAGLFVAAVLVLGIMGWRAGLFTSVETMQAFLESLGLWAPAAFLAIQIIQIVIPLIPGGITCSVGVIAFGPVFGFIYNYLGIVAGSILVFLLARRFGLPLIRSLVSEKSFEKYATWLDKEQPLFNKLFAAAIFLPFAPDDLLCMLAGVSKMKTSTFCLILVTCKIPFLIPYSLGLPAIVKWLGL